jgi:hypothetical protein
MAFVLCATAVSLAHRLLHRHTDPPHTLTELADLLRRSDPPLYVVPMTKHGPETGFYLCERPQPREHLLLLRRAAERGTVGAASSTARGTHRWARSR